MTFHPYAPGAAGRSAIELRDDDGRTVATIYAQRSGIEIAAEPRHAITTESDRSCVDRIHVTIRREDAL